MTGYIYKITKLRDGAIGWPRIGETFVGHNYQVWRPNHGHHDNTLCLFGDEAIIVVKCKIINK